MNSADISRGLISEKDIQGNLLKIFSDAIILDKHFKIIAVSDQIAAILGYPAADLVGKSFQQLSEDASDLELLKNELAKGVFDNLALPLKSGISGLVPYKVSGFYTGLFSDINGISVLKINHSEESKLLNKQLELSRNELDEFVYRTTHDLRGPLATMRGLINLMKLDSSSTSADMKDFISLLDTQAQTLDNRLFNLSYLSETAKSKTIDHQLDCAELESIMRSTLEQHLNINDVDFQFGSTQRYFNSINAQMTSALLNHLLLYLIELPKSDEVRLIYSIERISPGMRVTIYAEGFIGNFNIKQAMLKKESVYTTVINYSDLVNFFAALKSAERIGATVTIDFVYEMSQQITVFIPWEN